MREMRARRCSFGNSSRVSRGRVPIPWIIDHVAMARGTAGVVVSPYCPTTSQDRHPFWKTTACDLRARVMRVAYWPKTKGGPAYRASFVIVATPGVAMPGVGGVRSTAKRTESSRDFWDKT